MPGTRSNDGRADPQGGFWIGTMGKAREPGRTARSIATIAASCAGSIPGIAIPNAICFAPDGGAAYFADTPDPPGDAAAAGRRRLARRASPSCSSTSAPRACSRTAPLSTPRAASGTPSWGAAQVAEYDPAGKLLQPLSLCRRRMTTCPAFGGAGSDHAVSSPRPHARPPGAVDRQPPDMADLRCCGASAPVMPNIGSICEAAFGSPARRRACRATRRSVRPRADGAAPDARRNPARSAARRRGAWADARHRPTLPPI